MEYKMLIYIAHNRTRSLYTSDALNDACKACNCVLLLWSLHTC